MVVIQEQQIFAAREVTKADARPGGYVAAGGHGGIVGNISHTGRIALTYLPLFKHTYRSDLKITGLPNSVKAAKQGARGIETGRHRGEGRQRQASARRHSGRHHIERRQLLGDGLGHDTAPEIDLIASIEHKLGLGLLTGSSFRGWCPTAVRRRTRA